MAQITNHIKYDGTDYTAIIALECLGDLNLAFDHCRSLPRQYVMNDVHFECMFCLFWTIFSTTAYSVVFYYKGIPVQSDRNLILGHLAVVRSLEHWALALGDAQISRDSAGRLSAKNCM